MNKKKGDAVNRHRAIHRTTLRQLVADAQKRSFTFDDYGNVIHQKCGSNLGKSGLISGESKIYYCLECLETIEVPNSTGRDITAPSTSWPRPGGYKKRMT